MSMLAEKKRREKWSLNPRGKAWSEDQNKFGQRLMEKMGWKAGQGLGANSQGQTDIVKTRVKNDIKGLGFKENGEEWLKTTSDFDNLLEELASSQDDSGEGSQSETPASLEDRSKKSRARVHYHKFTRGKDLSRYSEKDLASIIGPDVIKLKNGQESKSDYTQNQVNKGSIEEYFKNKSKTKDVTADNIENGKTSSNLIEDLEISDSKMEGLDNTNEKLEADPESVNSVSPKKNKKKKRTVEDSESQVNSQDSGSYEVDENFLSPETEVPKIKKKKSKSSGMENNLQHEADDSVSLNFASSENSKTNRPKKDKGFSENIENSVHIDNLVSETLNNPDEKKPKKKKRKINDEEIEQSQDIDINTSKNSFVVDTGANEEIVPKKKKKRSKDESKEEHQVELQSDCNLTCTDPVASEETLVSGDLASKKKKKSNKNKEHHVSLEEQIENSFNNSENNLLASGDTVVSEEIPTKKKKKDKNKDKQDDLSNCYVMHTDENPVISEDTVTSSEPVEKKKKKKSKEKNSLLENESLVEEQLEIKKKCKKDAGENTGANETTPQCEQAKSRNTPGDFLEVLGRRTRLKAIKNIHKTASNESYNTEDFMLFCKTDNSHKGSTTCPDLKDSTSKDVNQNCVTSKAKPAQETVASPNNKKVITGNDVGNSKTLATTKKVEKSVNDEKDNYIKCYAETNTDDCKLPKHVVAYEYRLVCARLKRLDITPPEVKVVIKEANSLHETLKRKLKQIGKIRHLKALLPPHDLAEVEASVTKFHDSLKPKIEIMTAISEVEENMLKFADELDRKSELQSDKEEEVKLKSFSSEKAEEMIALFQKLETLLESYRKREEPIISESTNKDNDDDDEKDAEDQMELKLSWMKKVESKLDTLKQHMKMLKEGKKPPGLDIIKCSQNATKNAKGKKQFISRLKKNNHYQNTDYSRGRIAHNVADQRGRGRGIGHNQSAARSWPVQRGGTESFVHINAGRFMERGRVGGFFGRGRGFSDIGFSGRGRGFGDGGFSGQGRGFGDGGFSGRGRGFGDGGFSGRGRGFGDGAFSGQGRDFGGGGFSGQGRGFGDEGFSGRGRGFGDGGFSGRGRGFSGGGFMGRGRGGINRERGRGRITQNNFEAKLYAERCKELNKLPEVLFNGVNMKAISGYAANIDVNKNKSSTSEDSKALPV